MALPDLQQPSLPAERRPKKIHNPYTVSWPVSGDNPFDSRYVMPDGRVVRDENFISTDSPVAVFGGRRSGRGIGIQTDYGGNLPYGTIMRVVSLGKNVDVEEGARALAQNLHERLAAGENIVVFGGTGGEHISHVKTGGPPPDPERAAQYGELDPHRDASDETLLKFALKNGFPVDETCRNMQYLLNILTRGLPPHLRAIPQDHGQDHHHGKYETPEGTVLREHDVVKILDPDIEASMRTKPPRARRFNSAHSQAITLGMMSEDALTELANQRWYPLYRSNIPGEPEENQTYEAFVRVEDDGQVTGYAGQDHGESPNAPDGTLLRNFRRTIHTTSMLARQR